MHVVVDSRLGVGRRVKGQRLKGWLIKGRLVRQIWLLINFDLSTMALTHGGASTSPEYLRVLFFDFQLFM